MAEKKLSDILVELYTPLYNEILPSMKWMTISPASYDKDLDSQVNGWENYLRINFLDTICEKYIVVFELGENSRLHFHIVYSMKKGYLYNKRLFSFINSVRSLSRDPLPIYIKRPCQIKDYVGQPEKGIDYLFKESEGIYLTYEEYNFIDSSHIRSKAVSVGGDVFAYTLKIKNM